MWRGMELPQLCIGAGKCLLAKQICRHRDCAPAKERAGFDVSTRVAIARLIRSKRQANRRPVYLQSLLVYLKRFAQQFPSFSLVSSAEIEGFLAQFKNDNSRQTWLSRISTLYAFALRRGLVASNPCLQIDRVTIDRSAPVVLTVQQSRDLLASCPTVLRPYLVLGMFAGIRPAEIERLDWSQIDLATGTVSVDGKTRRRRLVPLEPIAIALLAKHPLKRGKVAPSPGSVRSWKRSARAILGGKWTADILRHTAASYLVAKYQDAGKVSLWLGNSAQILLTHYHHPITKEETKKFWNL